MSFNYDFFNDNPNNVDGVTAHQAQIMSLKELKDEISLAEQCVQENSILSQSHVAQKKHNIYVCSEELSARYSLKHLYEKKEWGFSYETLKEEVYKGIKFSLVSRRLSHDPMHSLEFIIFSTYLDGSTATEVQKRFNIRNKPPLFILGDEYIQDEAMKWFYCNIVDLWREIDK